MRHVSQVINEMEYLSRFHVEQKPRYKQIVPGVYSPVRNEKS